MPDSHDVRANNRSVATGGSIIDTACNWDYLTIKYGPDGETAWIRRYDSPNHGEDKPAAIALHLRSSFR